MNLSVGRIRVVAVRFFLPALFLLGLMTQTVTVHGDDTLSLDELVAEGLRNNPEILAAQARAQAAGFRVPQAKSLPDPMFMFGYQNEGFQRFDVGSAPANAAMGMFSLSQQFYFPGKRGLKGEAAAKDAGSLLAMHEEAKLQVASKIKQLYYSLFLSYKTDRHPER